MLANTEICPYKAKSKVGTKIHQVLSLEKQRSARMKQIQPRNGVNKLGTSLSKNFKTL